MTRFKKILAVSAIFSVFTFSGNANTALASSCPHHGSYWEQPVTITNIWTTDHKVPVNLFGGVVEVSCTVSHQGYIIGIYCAECGALVSTYKYELRLHSYSGCPDEKVFVE